MCGGVHTVLDSTRERAAPEELDAYSADCRVIASNTNPLLEPSTLWWSQMLYGQRKRKTPSAQGVKASPEKAKARKATRMPEVATLNCTCRCPHSYCHQDHTGDVAQRHVAGICFPCDIWGWSPLTVWAT